MRRWTTATLTVLLAAGCSAPRGEARPSTPPTSHQSTPPAPSPVSPPSPTPVPDVATGTFSHVADGETSVLGDAGVLVTYCVRVEDGINSFNTRQFAAVVDSTLADSRSWIAAKRWRFQRVPGCENVELTVNLATPPTVDRHCAGAARTGGEWSCHNNGGVYINLDRWKFGVVHDGGNLHAYRTMVINHEVGHSLGFSHVTCPGQGKTAPIMLPQSRGLNGCVFNPYPYPDGVRYIT